MSKTYVIQWKSKINGRAGKGTKQFSLEEAETLVQELNQWASEHLEVMPRTPKKNQVNDWMLLDWDDTVIHLFSETSRAYYELEKLWFSAKVLYSTKS